MGPSPTQELAQKVCQRYGWSARFEKEDYWVCYITVALNDTRRFVSSDNTSPIDRATGAKEGTAAAAQAALDGLQEEVARQEAKPKRELTDVFPLGSFQIKGSSHRNWEQFVWSRKPSVVGIDTEGNQNHPPVLVQVATEETVLLEITSINGNQLSADLQRLLADDTIVKVFCDNFAHHDKTSLGIHVDREKKDDFTKGSVVDLEAMTSALLGPVKVARGLSRIVTLVMPELNVLIQKQSAAKGGRFKDIGRFTLIEQGRLPPIKSLRDLSRKDQQYAALDAWATLQAYKRVQSSITGSHKWQQQQQQR